MFSPTIFQQPGIQSCRIRQINRQCKFAKKTPRFVQVAFDNFAGALEYCLVDRTIPAMLKIWNNAANRAALSADLLATSRTS